MSIRDRLAQAREESAGAPRTGLREHLRASRAQPEEPAEPIGSRPSLPDGMVPMGLEAAMTGAEHQLLDNALGLPDALLSLGNFAAQKGDEIRDRLLGVEPDQYRPFGQPVKEGLESIGLTPDKLLAEVYSGAGLFGDPDEEEQRLSRLKEEYPNWFGGGEIGGDVFSLLTGRGRMKRSLPAGERAGGVFDKAINDYITRKLPADGAEGFAPQVRQIMDSELFRHSMRGAGRSFETGIEAEFLNMLHGGDPGEMMGIGMAAQLVSSASLTTAAGMSELPVRLFGAKDMGKMTKGAIGVGLQSWIFGNMLQVLGQTQDEAAETSYDKVLAGFALAATVGLPGKRPKDDGVLKNFPLMADAVLAVPRAAGVNFVESLRDASEEVQKLNTMMAESPEMFSEKDREKYQSIIMAGGKGLEEFGQKAYSKYFGAEDPELPPVLLEVPVSPKRRRNRGIGFQ